MDHGSSSSGGGHADFTMSGFFAAHGGDLEDDSGPAFAIHSERFLRIKVDGRTWIRHGSMVCYQGSIKFNREGILEHGLGKMLKRKIAGEQMVFVKAEGKGVLFTAHQGKSVQIINLGEDDELIVNGSDVLAFEDGMKWDIRRMKQIAGAMQGGLFHVSFKGRGHVAISTMFEPMTIRVKSGHPVFTDPGATVAWSGSLAPSIHTDISLKTLIGRGSGESFQMKFDGDGFVVVQPFEELYVQRAS